MTPQNEIRLRRIKRMSLVLRCVCKYVLGALIFSTAAVVFALTREGGSIGFFDLWFKVADLTPANRVLIGAMGVATFGVLFKCFYHLHSLMTNYSRAEIFTVQSASHIRKTGIFCALFGATQILWARVPHF